MFTTHALKWCFLAFRQKLYENVRLNFITGFAKEYHRATPNEEEIGGNDDQVTRMKSLDNQKSLASTKSEDLLESQSSNIVLEFRSSSYCMATQNGRSLAI